MLRHDVGSVDSAAVDKVVDDTARWSSSLANALASFTNGQVYRDTVSGALLFGPQPEIAPLAFTYAVFAAGEGPTLRLFEAKRNVAVHQPYRKILLYANGVRSRAIQLFGIPSAQNAATGLIDDWLFQPLQLESAQQGWRFTYRPLCDEFMIGSMFVSSTENSGLFCCDDLYVECSKDGGLVHYETLDDAVEAALRRDRNAA